MTRICVFCGSNSGSLPAYVAAARQLAMELVAREIGLVPHALVARELAHRGVQDLRVVSSMHERKALMAELSDAFIALPGGFGTFEELCEVITWTQLGLHRKRCGLMNVQGFYDPLL